MKSRTFIYEIYTYERKKSSVMKEDVFVLYMYITANYVLELVHDEKENAFTKL